MFKPTKRIEGAHEEGIWAVQWRGDNICSGSLDGKVKLWNNNLNLIGTSSALKMGITSLSILRNLNMIISCCQDSTIQIHNMTNFDSVDTIQPGLLESWTISTSPCNKMIAGGSHSGNVNVWSVQDRNKIATFETGKKMIIDTAFSPSGDKLAAVGADGYLTIFDIQESACVYQTEAHALPVRCVTFSPDGNLLYTASIDRHVNVFDLNHNVPINSFSHNGMALCVDASVDNRHFISSCSNHSVHVWDIGMQRCVQSFDTLHSDQVWSVSYNDSGDKFVSVGDDSLMQLYESSSR